MPRPSRPAMVRSCLARRGGSPQPCIHAERCLHHPPCACRGMKRIEQDVAFVGLEVAWSQPGRHNDRRDDESSRTQRRRPCVALVPACFSFACGKGKIGCLDGNVVGKFDGKRAEGPREALRAEVDELFDQGEGDVRCRVHHGNAGTVPSPAIEPGAFAIDLGIAPERQTPGPHLFDDPVRNASQHGFDEPAAFLGIEQRERRLTGQGAILLA